MKKLILGLALATTIISCKKEGTEVKETTTTTVEAETPAATDTVIKTETTTTTTVDTLNTPGS